MRSIVSLTARSLPGIGVAEKTTVSPSWKCDLRVVAVGHAPQRGQRLALASRGDHDELVVREVLDLPRAHQYALRDIDMAEHAADVHVLAHRAADERDLAAELARRVHHLLHAVDVGGEAGDDDATLAAGEDLNEPRPNRGLGERDAGAIRIRRVAAEEQQALAPELGEP